MLNSHLKFAHMIWRSIIQPGDTVIDATLGNGHDALALIQMLQNNGTLIGYDIQKKAILQTQTLLKHEKNSTIILNHCCHSKIKAKNPKLIVYNLGYLPGTDKALTTQITTTLKSIQKAQKLVLPEGVISITLYPGHKEGLEEQDVLTTYAKLLDKRSWNVSWTSWPNRLTGPSLLLLQKKSTSLPS